MASQPIIDFIKELLKRTELVTDGNYDQSYVETLANEVEKKMGIAVMDELDEESMFDYAKLVNDGKTVDPQVSNDFFKSHIQDFENKRMKILQDFAANFLVRTKQMKDLMNS
jgi:hypothetical protein